MKQLISSFLFLFCSQIQAQDIDVRFIGLEEDIDSLMYTYQTIGMSISIVENGKIIYSKGFGYRNLEKKLPVTPNTIFPIGSVSKPITASLIGVYLGKDKLSVTDRPSKFIPYLRFSTDEMNNLITIEDLLSHNSGIGVVDATHVFFPTDDIEKHLKRLTRLAPNSSVRERFDYSNMGYAILGEVSSQISGKTWAENVQDEIFNPLQMKHSNCSLDALQSSDNYSLGYSITNGNPIEVVYEDQHESYASGAINSSSLDLSKWVVMLLNGGLYNDKQLIPKQYLENSFSEHNIIRGSFSFDKKYNLLTDTYGYGWFVHQYNDLYRVNHAGNVSGFTASVDLYPHKKIGIIILTNQGSSNLLTKPISDMVLNRLLDLDKKSWKDYEIKIGEAIVPNVSFKPINTEKKTSHELKDFCGKYFSEAYGIVSVFLEGENLMIKFPAFKMYLEHVGYNTFINRVTEIHHQNTPSFYINFYSDNNGEVSELSIKFSDAPEHFIKME
ncbi:serine hydrolase [uncultured Aquimarina sp.]|uniref:serine hydrolase n=1 Tax=uncultured Aquimarina sp. TaxID=575652 RepID=UPI0026030BB1|nr:serine hydrolase [uncultured Aquimarina sp.]